MQMAFVLIHVCTQMYMCIHVGIIFIYTVQFYHYDINEFSSVSVHDSKINMYINQVATWMIEQDVHVFL